MKGSLNSLDRAGPKARDAPGVPTCRRTRPRPACGPGTNLRLTRPDGPGLADGALLAQLGAPARLAGLLVVLALAELLLDAAPLQQLLEAAQGQPDRLPVVDTHP